MTFDATVVTVSCEWSIGYFTRIPFTIAFRVLNAVVMVLLRTDRFIIIIIISFILLMLLTVTVTVVLISRILLLSTCHLGLELFVHQTDELLQLSISSCECRVGQRRDLDCAGGRRWQLLDDDRYLVGGVDVVRDAEQVVYALCAKH